MYLTHSILSKKDFIENLIKIMPHNEPYIESRDIVDRLYKMTHRLFQLRYAVIHLGFLIKLFELRKKEQISYEDNIENEYGIYLSYIVVELSILLNLDTGKKDSDSANKLFNSVNQYLLKYYKDGAYIVANGAICFDPTYYREAYDSYKTRLNINQKEIEEIRVLRIMFSAHHDLRFLVKTFNFAAVANIVIELENVWLNLCKSMGILTYEREFKQFDLDKYKTGISDYRNEINKVLKKHQKQYNLTD